MAIRIIMFLGILALCLYILSTILKLFWGAKAYGMFREKLNEYDVKLSTTQSVMMELERHIQEVEELQEQGEALAQAVTTEEPVKPVTKPEAKSNSKSKSLRDKGDVK